MTAPLRRAVLDADALRSNLAELRRTRSTATPVDLRGDAWGHGRALAEPLVRDAGFRTVLGDEAAGERPEAIGAELFGLSAVVGGEADAALIPVLTLRAVVIGLKDAPAEAGISYGHTYRTQAATRLALVGAGYGDGLPRVASNRGPLLLGGRRLTIAGRMAMDAVVVDIGDAPVAVGDEGVLIGRADRGEPTAAEWGALVGRSSAEIVARLLPRVGREVTA